MERDIFYIAGYDPRSYRHYYLLFKDNLAKFNKINSFDFNISKINKDEKYPYFNIKNEETNIKYHFLPWNDVVKKNWSKTYFDAWKDWFDVFKIFVITGLFLKFAKESIYQIITGYYPLVYMLFSVLFSFLFSFGIYFFIEKYFGIFSIFIFLLLFLIFNKLFFELGKKIAVFWISRICSFCANFQRKRKGELDQKINDFALYIFDILKKNHNNKNYEMLLISHSVGTIVSICVAALVLKKCKEENIDFKKFKMLTLGECIPLLSYQKNCDEFKKELEYVASFNITWYDFTSIIDGACFPQVDFIKTSGVNSKYGPKLYSAKFHTLYEKNNYKKIKKDKYNAHFLYLFANELSGRYDFFKFCLNKEFLEQK